MNELSIFKYDLPYICTIARVYCESNVGFVSRSIICIKFISPLNYLLRLDVDTSANITNIAGKGSLHINRAIRFECNSTFRAFVAASWYTVRASLCPNSIFFHRFPNHMCEMTSFIIKSLAPI